MAEAAIQSLNASTFICHKCALEIHPVLPEYSCPLCKCGFIEELTQGSTGNIIEESDENFEPVSLTVEMRNMDDALRRCALARNHELSAQDDQHSNSGSSDLLSGPSSSQRNHIAEAIRQSSREISGREQRLLGSLQRLNAASTTLIAMLEEQRRILTHPGYSMPMSLHSNPGDYAWGSDGLDVVITQLLNEVDDSGPPPLSRDKIEKVPSVLISQDQVDKNLQCTVCMEDFMPGGPVKKLSCDHHFHTECIAPWLELHGTCPICRKLLNDDCLPQPESLSSRFHHSRPRSL